MPPSRRGALAFSAVAALLAIFPFFGSPYFVTRIFAPSFFLGIAALSLAFLAGHGGMVSLAQMTVFGLAGYGVGILTVVHQLPWWLGALAGICGATLAAFIFGLIAVRTQGVYFLMITLALGMLIFYLANQNRSIFGGHTGINGIRAPVVFGHALSEAVPFYYLCLATAAACFGSVRYLLRAPFGLALQGVRDNQRRMTALGYRVQAHRVAAFTLAGLIASVGGVLGVWYNGAISPAYIDLTRIINILVIAVIGGLTFPEGAFLGALVFVLLTNLASSYTDRYNTVIGLTFLIIVLLSPEGLTGIVARASRLVRWAWPASSPQARGGINGRGNEQGGLGASGRDVAEKRF